MKKLQEIYKKILKTQPESIKTKIKKSSLERGGDGIYTKRRKRWDVVLINYDSFINIYESNLTSIESIYKHGYYVVLTPEQYSKLENKNFNFLIVYKSFEEEKNYPYDKNDITCKVDNKIVGNIVVDIKNLDKHKKKGSTIYKGVKHIGQHDYDFATKEECEFVQYSLLYQILKFVDFDDFNDEKTINLKSEYIIEFESSKLFNSIVQKYTQNGSICPVLNVHLKYEDLINGKIEGDTGRNDFNRTTTKINLHHLHHLRSGKQNHNHENVILGTAEGNTIDSALIRSNTTLNDIFLNRLSNDSSLLDKICKEYNLVKNS